MISEESVALKRAFRLRHNSDFQRVRQQGRSIASRLLILAWTPNPQGGVRVGFVVSKRVSKLAVRRNYIKRLLGEAMRPYLTKLSGDWDVVITVRSYKSDVTLSSVTRELETALHRAKLLAPSSEHQEQQL